MLSFIFLFCTNKKTWRFLSVGDFIAYEINSNVTHGRKMLEKLVGKLYNIHLVKWASASQACRICLSHGSVCFVADHAIFMDTHLWPKLNSTERNWVPFFMTSIYSKIHQARTHKTKHFEEMQRERERGREMAKCDDNKNEGVKHLRSDELFAILQSGRREKRV